MTHVTSLDWDSSFFGAHIGRLDIPDKALSSEALSEGIRIARRRNIACLYFEVPFARASDLSGLSGPGIHLVDIKTTLTKSLAADEGAEEGGVLDFAPARHYPDLESIAEELAFHSRFRFDGHFGEEGSKRLYREWLRRSAHEGFSSDFLVFLDESGVEGFLTIRMKQGAPFIDLLGVARRARGRGVSERLIRAAESRLRRRGFDRLAVVTQGHNIAALRAYEKSGFAVHSVKLFYHLWPGEMAP